MLADVMKPLRCVILGGRGDDEDSAEKSNRNRDPFSGRSDPTPSSTAYTIQIDDRRIEVAFR